MTGRRILLASTLLFAGSAVAQPRTDPKKPPAPPPPGTTTTVAAPTPTPPPPPAPTPAPAVPTTGTPSTTPDLAAAGEGADVDALRQEYLQLRDELFESRARAATIASALYSTRVQIRFGFGSARFWGVGRAVIRLDGASVFDDTAGVVGTDDAVRFDGWIAPGRHRVTLRLETVGKDDDRFTTATETTFIAQAVAGKDLEITARTSDNGDIAYAWKRGEHGTYRIGIDVDVKTTARATADKKATHAK
jgi:hypothetical protein